MTIDGEVSKILLALAGLVVAVVQTLAHLELKKLQKDAPDVLKRAGINEIDWWLSCMVGVIRLGFGDIRNLVPPRPRIVFVCYGAMVGLAVAGVFFLLLYD